MTVGDEAARPRPRFGEYASEEEQRSRIRQPEVTDLLSTGGAPDEAPAATPVMAAPTPKPAGGANRLATILLLAVGAANVLFSVIGYLDLASSIERTLELMGVPGEFTNIAAAQTWGAVSAAVMVGGFVLTAVLAWRRLRAGRSSWWIPLVGAVVTYVIVSVCLSVPLLGDPAFTAYVTSLS
ncbi:DUF6264 family protein [Microbacterium koreense]|uniref:DUF6264 family protein n=1 Tax=Microbacterium koreense TaxID=323761 RepID=A0ABW2ZR22_9MICO